MREYWLVPQQLERGMLITHAVWEGELAVSIQEKCALVIERVFGGIEPHRYRCRYPHHGEPLHRAWRAITADEACVILWGTGADLADHPELLEPEDLT